jgi:hypothetical protein
MQKKGLFCLAPIAALVFVAACSGGDKQPVSPSSNRAANLTGGSAVSDTVTLKVNAPALVSPIGGRQLTEMQATLTFQPATAKYVTGESFTYRVQLLNAGSTVLEEKTGTATSYKMSTQFETSTVYRWRVRAEMQGQAGPWSTTETFKSMDRTTGYIRGNEVYDPLIDGVSIGRITGPVEWIPGVGVKLLGDESSIEYRLQETCTAGEFSMIVTGVGGDTGTDKSKIMAMREENGLSPAERNFLVNNDRRMTVEKRSDGNVAWRFITADDQVDTLGAERRSAGIRDEGTYLWTATWNGVFTLRIQQLPAMNVMYEFGKGYHGRAYDPNPHMAYVGSGSTYSGHGTVAGMVVRHVWLSPNPRPSWANQ